MSPKIKFTSLLILILNLLFIDIVVAQIRKGGGGRKGSLYFSGGMNMATFNKPNIQINQPSLGNSYTLSNVAADNKSSTTGISPALLNYRVGYYFGYYQKYGIELNYDPVVYHLTDGQSIVEKGTINDVSNINTTIKFSQKSGYYYSLNGANLLLVNLVRRITLFRPNSNRIAVDFLIKAGVGPALPNVESGLPGPKFDAPAYGYGGWNAGLEGAFRIAFYRYVYLEIAAKYDYASFTGLNIMHGTASENLGTTEYIASLGFTFPTKHFNPLFYKGKRIITIMPLYTLKDHPGKSYGDSKSEKNEKNEEAKAGDNEITDIPEFSDIVKRKPRTLPADTSKNHAATDSLNAPPNAMATNSTPPEEHETRRERRRNRKHAQDSVAAADNSVAAPPATRDTATQQLMDSPAKQPVAPEASNKQITDNSDNKNNIVAKDTTTSAPSAKGSVNAGPTADSTPLTKKEKKRLEKQAKKEQREKEAQEKKEQREKEKQAERDKKAQEEKDRNDKLQNEKDVEKSDTTSGK